MRKCAFEKADWIWIHGENKPDEYAEFFFSFTAKKRSDYRLFLTADSNYNVFLNGALVGFGQPTDYPHYKIYDTIPLSAVREGKNEIKIVVWYYGEDTQTYKADEAGAIFELCEGETVVYASGEGTQGRLCEAYANYRNKRITTQLGLGYAYDGGAKNDAPLRKCVVRKKGRNFVPRATAPLEMKERVPVDIVKTADGWLVDMREETVGFLELEFESDRAATVTVAYGEYLTPEGGVRRFMNDRDDFSVTYIAKKGRNAYTNCFRRLAGRFLQIFTDADLTIAYIGLRPVVYPLTPKPVRFRSSLRNRIYETCVKTLLSCMHEHYEDCPWREQALYNMDGRNEMLCTYDAFGDFTYARANLVLMAQGLREDGLLNICFPSVETLPIPSFSMIYPVEVCEYIERSGDETILDEVFGTVSAIMETFLAALDKDTHLLADFPYPAWNFYEWAEGSDNCNQISRGADEENPLVYRLSLNCELLFALPYYRKLCAMAGKAFSFDETALRKAVQKTFFVPETGLYKERHSGEPYYTVLGNSYAVLSGVGGAEIAEKLVRAEGLVPVTLSMCIFLYEALLKTDKRYARFILEDIDRRYHRMLAAGATTFWETEMGKDGNDHTGSLCHGWSALPIHYYSLLNGKDYFDGEL